MEDGELSGELKGSDTDNVKSLRYYRKTFYIASKYLRRWVLLCVNAYFNAEAAENRREELKVRHYFADRFSSL